MLLEHRLVLSEAAKGINWAVLHEVRFKPHVPWTKHIQTMTFGRISSMVVQQTLSLAPATIPRKSQHFWAGCNPLPRNKLHYPSYFALFTLSQCSSQTVCCIIGHLLSFCSTVTDEAHFMYLQRSFNICSLKYTVYISGPYMELTCSLSLWCVLLLFRVSS